ncbi:MAG: septum formation initiator family protein [Lysobacterales bacterium]
MRLINLIFIALTVVLQYQLWFAQGGLRDSWRLQRAVASQIENNETQVNSNRELRAQVQDLKSGSQAVEELARSELGLLGPDESFYQIVESRSASL